MLKVRKNQKGGATQEYILMVVIVLVILLVLFWSSLRDIILNKLGMMSSTIQTVGKTQVESGSSSSGSSGGTWTGNNESPDWGSTSENSTGPVISH